MPPSAPPRPSYGTTQIPITRQAGSSRRRPAELGYPPGEAWAPVRERYVPPVPGRKELERAGAEQHFTPKFPPLNRLEFMKLSVYLVNTLGKKGYLKSFLNKVKSLPSLVSDHPGLYSA